MNAENRNRNSPLSASPASLNAISTYIYQRKKNPLNTHFLFFYFSFHFISSDRAFSGVKRKNKILESQSESKRWQATRQWLGSVWSNAAAAGLFFLCLSSFWTGISCSLGHHFVSANKNNGKMTTEYADCDTTRRTQSLQWNAAIRFCGLSIQLGFVHIFLFRFCFNWSPESINDEKKLLFFSAWTNNYQQKHSVKRFFFLFPFGITDLCRCAFCWRGAIFSLPRFGFHSHIKTQIVSSVKFNLEIINAWLDSMCGVSNAFVRIYNRTT